MYERIEVLILGTCCIGLRLPVRGRDELVLVDSKRLRGSINAGGVL